MIYTVRDFWDRSCHTEVDGRWVLSVPVRYYGGYIQAAWAVLRGKAVALRYPVAGELEKALDPERAARGRGRDERGRSNPNSGASMR